jgi:hypothetical protein
MTLDSRFLFHVLFSAYLSFEATTAAAAVEVNAKMDNGNELEPHSQT